MGGLRDFIYYWWKGRRLRVNFDQYSFIKGIDVEIGRYKNQSLKPKDNYSIAFLIPGLPRYSGGHTSIMRIGTYLMELGHRVSYITVDDMDPAQMMANASVNLPGFKGEFLPRSGLDKPFDIAVATFWTTAYHMYGRDNFAYKCYFIQDFEPYFYEIGDMYYFALNTYRLNYHMISLGQWNPAQIKKNVGEDVKVDWIDFPGDSGGREIVDRKICIGKKLKMAAYAKFSGRRAPLFLLQSLDQLEKTLKKKNIGLDIKIFGMEKHVEVPVGKNVGKLNSQQLKKLYCESDIGVVFSLSNISLIPYEMTAAGLPVIELADGSASEFFQRDSLILCDFFPQDFVSKVLYYIEHQDELNRMVKKAQEKIRGKSWEKSAKQFIQAIKSKT